MPNVNWNSQVIAELAAMVRDHNERADTPAAKTKLTDLKKAYARGYHGTSLDARGRNGMAKVVRHLESLAKAGGNFDSGKHPRGAKGEFASGGAKAKAAAPSIETIPLPKTRAQHVKLQDTNAGYRALTTDIVPENRNAVKGAWARYAGSTALGAGLILSLAHRGGEGAAARLLRAGGRKIGGVLLGVPTAAATYTATGAEHAIRAKVARQFGRSLRDSDYKLARAATKSATKMGGYLGEKAGQGATSGMRLVVDSATRAGSDLLHPKAARAGVLAGLSLGTGLLINNQIEGSAVDPEAIGRGYDAFSYRTIEKMAGGAAALDAVATDFLAKVSAGDVEEELAKAGFYNQVGMRVLPALAGLIGGAGVAGAAEAGHAIAGTRRDDYARDAHGRFASKANAITAGSAVAAALATGAGAYLALRHHNVGQLVTHVDAIADTIAKHMELVHSPNGVGPVADLIAKGRETIRDLHAGRALAINHRALKEDPEYQADLERLKSWSGASEAHIKSRIRSEVNGKLAEVLSQHNEFRIPEPGKPPENWKTIGELRDGALSRNADKAAYDAVHKAVDSASPEQFEQAIASLPSEGLKDTARHWMNLRATAIESVPGQIKAHGDKIAAATQALAAAKDAHSAKNVAMLDAKALVDRTTDEAEKATHTAAFEAAMADHDKSGKAVERAERALGKLQDAPSGVLGPVSNKPIAPATEAEIEPHRGMARAAALRRAEKKVDGDIAKQTKKINGDIDAARQSQAAALRLSGDRMLASRALLGHKLNILPDEAAYAGIRAAAFRRSIDKARAELQTARGNLAAAEKRAADLKLAQKGRAPKGMSPEDAADLVANASSVQDAVTAAKLHVGQSEGRVSAREFLMRKHSQAFHDALHPVPAKPMAVGTRMPSSHYRALLRDVGRATEDLHKPVNRFLHSPTAGALKDFAVSVGDHVSGAATGAAHAFRDVYRTMLMRKTGDGPNDYAIDPAKLLIRGGLGIVAGDVAHDLYHYGKDQVTHALGGGTGKPKQFPRSIKIEKHVDPYNGSGFVGLSVADPDPENKGDRVLLWGQSFKDHTGRAEDLHPGARVSGLRNRFSGGNGGSAGGGGGGGNFVPQDRDIPGLPDDVKQTVRQSIGKLKDRMHTVRVEDGHEIKFRPNSDTGEDQAAGKIVDHIKKQFLNTGTPPKGGMYHGALAAAVGSNQSRVLKQRQVYELLTGFSSKGGTRTGKSIFHTGDDSDFGEVNDKEAVLTALKDEVKRVADEDPPRDDAQRTNLMRAAAVIGQQKGISHEDLKPVYETIRGGKSTTPPAPPPSAPAPTQGPKIIESVPLARAHDPKVTADTAVHRNDTKDWDQAKLREMSLPHAKVVAQGLGMNTEAKIVDTAAALEHFAKTVHKTHGLDMRSSLFAARNAVINSHGGDQGGKTVTRDALRDVDADHFSHHLDAAADAEVARMNKIAEIEDLDALMKGVFGDIADAASDSWQSEARVPNGAGGGEFSGGGRSMAGQVASRVKSRLVREGVDETVDRTGRKAAQRTQPSGSNYTPTKIAADIGGLGLGEAAAYGIGKLFPEEAGAAGILSAVRDAYNAGGAGAASRAAVHAAGAVAGRAARSVPKLAATSAGGLAGYAAGSAAGEGAVRAAYGAAGKKAPVAAPPKLSVGEGVAESLGSIGGAIIGGTFGGGVGSIATGAAGGYAGGVIGRNAYDAGASLAHLFTGYGAKHQAAAVNTLRRATTPATGA